MDPEELKTNLAKFQKQEKRGGVRRSCKVKPDNKIVNYYVSSEQGILPKKLVDYRFIIACDMTPADLIFLSVFSFWININSNIFNSRNNFPIYGFLFSKNSESMYKQAQKYMSNLGQLMGWDYYENHLYNNYKSVRYWYNEAETTEIPEKVQSDLEKTYKYNEKIDKFNSLEKFDISKIKSSHEKIFLINLNNTENIPNIKSIGKSLSNSIVIPQCMPLTLTNTPKLFHELGQIRDNYDFGPLASVYTGMNIYNDYYISKLTRNLPENTDYESPTGVNDAISKITLPQLEKDIFFTNGILIESEPMVAAFALLAAGGCKSEISLKNLDKITSKELKFMEKALIFGVNSM
jgi:hypothetical protein